MRITIRLNEVEQSSVLWNIIFGINPFMDKPGFGKQAQEVSFPWLLLAVSDHIHPQRCRITTDTNKIIDQSCRQQ
jgi:hypothetical protein